MKKLLLLLVLVSGIAQAQLNSDANFVKSNYSEMYSDIKASAIAKWGNDHGMVVYTINNQSEDFNELMKSYSASHYKIMNAAIRKWGTDKSYNTRVMARRTWNFTDIKADWGMVKYTYDNQVEAKSSY